MGKSIFLVIIALLIAIAGIIVNPKKDKEEPIFKLRPLGIGLIVLLIVFAIFQIIQIYDDDQSMQADKSSLLAKNKRDSIYQQRELNDRNKLIVKNENIIKLQDTSLNQQRQIVELQNELINRFKKENQQIKEKLVLIQDENKRSNYKVKPIIDASINIPLSDYSVTRNTKHRIPMKEYYFLNGRDTIFQMVPSTEIFSDSLCLEILRSIFGANILIGLEIKKANNIDSDWIRSIYKVQLVEKDSNQGFKIVAHWDTNLASDIKDKSDKRITRSDIGVFGDGSDQWFLKVNLYKIPLNIEGINPDLSILDLITVDNLYTIRHNCKLLDLDYSLTFKGDYSSYRIKLEWKSRPIDYNNISKHSIIESEQFIVSSEALFSNTSEILTLEGFSDW